MREEPRRRWIIANLDAEVAWAAGDGEAPSGKGTSPGVSDATRETIAALGTLLRVFARPGDVLWTAASVDPQRLVDAPPLVRPKLVSGSLSKLAEDVASPDAVHRVLAWGETAEIEALRRALAESLPASTASVNTPLRELVWSAVPSADVARQVNSRAFDLELARRLDTALRGTALVRNPTELQDHLERDFASGRHGGRWVLKALLSASGRERFLGAGGSPPAGKDARTIENLFERGGVLRLEPWVERVADFGCTAWVDAAGARVLGVHRQSVDRVGRFRGIEVPAEKETLSPPGIDTATAESFRETVVLVGDALKDAGYRGPYGVDAWSYRGDDGATRFQPLGEINARLGFGFVAQAWVETLREAGTVPRDRAIWLRTGRTGDEQDERTREVESKLMLLLPAAGRPVASWLGWQEEL